MAFSRRSIRFAAAGAFAASLALPLGAGIASAQEICPTASPSDIACSPPPVEVPEVSSFPAEGEVAVKGVSVSASSGLPVTGGDVAGMAMLGAVALGTGGVMVRVGRRRRAIEG